MKYTNAQIARHLAVKEADIRETAEREATGEIVVILSDFRKLVFPASALKGDPDPVEPAPGDPAPGDPAPLPVTVSGKVVPRK